MKIDNFKKARLIEFCRNNGIATNKKNRQELIHIAHNYQKTKIEDAISKGVDLELLKSEIKIIADEYSEKLKFNINSRKEEMKKDDNSHYLIYRVLGISNDEGKLIDEYQNTGRFLYKYAGSFLEEIASLCLFFSNREGGKKLIENRESRKPKTFEIDFLNKDKAIELKWRDATTDGDHITKEHTRINAIKQSGYIPIRIMFYYPQREQSIKIQNTLKTLYKGIGGEYYAGNDAWNYLKKTSGYNLKEILTEIAEKK